MLKIFNLNPFSGELFRLENVVNCFGSLQFKFKFSLSVVSFISSLAIHHNFYNLTTAYYNQLINKLNQLNFESSNMKTEKKSHDIKTKTEKCLKGLEKFNDFTTSYYFRASNRADMCLKQILIKQCRLNYLKEIISINGKCKGFNDIKNAMYKYGMSDTLIMIIIEKIIQFGHIPKFFNIGKIKPIVKDDTKSCCDLNNFRPFTISNVLSNIFEKIMLFEIMKSYDVPERQQGFKKKAHVLMTFLLLKRQLKATGQSSPTNLEMFKTIISEINGNSNFILLNDKITLITNTTIGLVKEIIKKHQSQIKIISNKILKINNLIRVKQGGPISPKSFSIYTEDWIKELGCKEIGTKICGYFTGVFMYADDILLLTHNLKYLGVILNRNNNNKDKYTSINNKSISKEFLECLEEYKIEVHKIIQLVELKRKDLMKKETNCISDSIEECLRKMGNETYQRMLKTLKLCLIYCI
ncbi:RNA-directed DNA polymerase from mobile element jockey-like [Brachionus plicatilis]|uniref:RNA-directed DNA polymerase from mobile element jockey-like n=1 Tax=Brachionus plicatilis TaxID=10195 RepID=A0A3M7R652_BRAPC|nr:RNA-directed DNA polymerase from mobile element jockey-like [Brachionus plicatilis]